MPQDNRSLYEILGVTYRARPHEIERAYRRRRFEMQQETAAPDPREGVLLQNAYDVLSDPVRRENYDETLRPGVRAMRRVQASPRVRAAIAVAGIAIAGLVAYFAFRPEERQRPRDPKEIAEAASAAVGRVQGIDVAGKVTPLGLAFAIQEGALATNCTGLSPSSQLVVSFAQRKVPARVATIYPQDEVCRLAADGMGSWPLAIAPAMPREGDRVHATQLGANGQVALVDGKVSRVARSENGTVTIQVSGPASFQLAGGPLLDAQGRVLGVAEGGGRYRPVPKAWIAEMNLPPPQEAPAQPAAAEKREPKAPIALEAEKAAHERAEKLRYLENLT
jgi:hypothetical protein